MEMGFQRYSSLLAVLLTGVVITGCGKDVEPSLPKNSLVEPFQKEPDRYLVKYYNPLLMTFRFERTQFLVDTAGYGSQAEKIRENLYRVSINDKTRIGEVLENIRADQEVEYVEPDWTVRAFYEPNDPKWNEQWAHGAMKMEKAWDKGLGDKKIVVAVIDTGIDYRHEDLKANMWKNPDEIPGNGKDDDGNGLIDDVYGWDFKNNDNEPISDDDVSHGSHCAGIIGAVGNNATGISGVSPNVSLMALKFLGGDGSGSISDAIKAIDYAIDKKVHIMSNSWGSVMPSQTLKDAIERAKVAGILFVAAAGNDSRNNDSSGTYPANYTLGNMISVAATTISDGMASFSNWGKQKVHLGAPGLDIYATVNDDKYRNLSGTSMATPQVAGLAALLWSERPELKYWDIKAVMMDTVDKISSLQGKVISDGRINADSAMTAIQTKDPGKEPDPVDPVDPPPPTGNIARPPLLAGQTQLRVGNPYQTIPIVYDLTEFQGTQFGYIEVSRPNTPFANPNGNTPDPGSLTWAARPGPRNQLYITPAQHLPSWGTYQFRVIPLDGNRKAVGNFSNSSTLLLMPGLM